MNTQSLSPVSSVHTNGGGVPGGGVGSASPYDPSSARGSAAREDGELDHLPSGSGDGSGDETDALYAALHHRLVTTGEWHRLSNTLEQLLLDSSWSVDLADYAAERARGMQELSLDELVKDVREEGKGTIPGGVKREMLKLIREFLDRNVEDEEE